MFHQKKNKERSKNRTTGLQICHKRALNHQRQSRRIAKSTVVNLRLKNIDCKCKGTFCKNVNGTLCSAFCKSLIVQMLLHTSFVKSSLLPLLAIN